MNLREPLRSSPRQRIQSYFHLHSDRTQRAHQEQETRVHDSARSGGNGSIDDNLGDGGSSRLRGEGWLGSNSSSFGTEPRNSFSSSNRQAVATPTGPIRGKHSAGKRQRRLSKLAVKQFHHKPQECTGKCERVRWPNLQSSALLRARSH